jgi:hypothetical protein
MVKIGSAQCGTVCSERPLNALDLKAFRTSRTHGVQGVECSNHSVPTKILQRIQSLNGGWIFLCLIDFSWPAILPHFLPHRDVD